MTRRVELLAVITGVLTGLSVAAFDRVVADQAVGHLLDAPLWLQAAVPPAGLAIAGLILRYVGRGTTPMTADAYIRYFHDDENEFDMKSAPARVLASAATLGSGNAMGFGGPSIYMGAAIGAWLQRQFRRAFRPTDRKLLLVCGAAAGVAAIFKAPATGLVFALEVPYRQDLARRMLLPAMFAAAASYVVYAAINGTDPIFHISGTPPFDVRDLGGAAALGLICGGGARLFSVALMAAKGAV